MTAISWQRLLLLFGAQSLQLHLWNISGVIMKLSYSEELNSPNLVTNFKINWLKLGSENDKMI